MRKGKSTIKFNAQRLKMAKVWYSKIMDKTWFLVADFDIELVSFLRSVEVVLKITLR